jgi:nitroreductase
MLDYEKLLDLMKTRRSVRRLQSDPVSVEDVDRILEGARWAPSGANTQPWEFIVVRDGETRNRILDAVEGTISVDQLRKVPVLIVVCGDTRVKVLYPGGRHIGYMDRIKLREQQTELDDDILNSSLSNAFMYMLLAATSLGLGTRYITSTRRQPAHLKIKEILNLPEYLVIYDTIALGYPASKPRPKTLRPFSEVVHMESFDESKGPSDDEILERAEQVKKRFGL